MTGDGIGVVFGIENMIDAEGALDKPYNSGNGVAEATKQNELTEIERPLSLLGSSLEIPKRSAYTKTRMTCVAESM